MSFAGMGGGRRGLSSDVLEPGDHDGLPGLNSSGVRTGIFPGGGIGVSRRLRRAASAARERHLDGFVPAS